MALKLLDPKGIRRQLPLATIIVLLAESGTRLKRRPLAIICLTACFIVLCTVNFELLFLHRVHVHDADPCRCHGMSVEDTPEFVLAVSHKHRCLLEYRTQLEADRLHLETMNLSDLTPDQQRERDDALYFDGVPSFLRRERGDAVLARSRRQFPAHRSAMIGENFFVSPSSLCFALDENKPDYSLLRPHIFSKGEWRNWYKSIGHSGSPATKGLSSPQSFRENVSVIYGTAEKNTSKPPDDRVPPSSFQVDRDEKNRYPQKLRPEAPASLSIHRDAVVKLAAAFSIYDANPRSESVIPAYVSACVGHIDCGFIYQHIDIVYEFGVGYFAWALNTQQKEPHELAMLLQKAFPTRFILITSDRQLGLSEIWNRFSTIFFLGLTGPLPWFINANADFLPRIDALKRFLVYAHHTMRNDKQHTFITFGAFSYFIHTYRAYMVLGDFDEVVFPSYTEDAEMYFRARSMGLYFQGCTYWANKSDYTHPGSTSQKVGRLHEMIRRFDSRQYLLDKYNVDIALVNWELADESNIYRRPFNISCIPHRNSFVVDPSHRHCVLTGEENRLNRDRQCNYDTEMIKKQLKGV